MYILPRGDPAMKTALTVVWPGSPGPASWATPQGLWVHPVTKDVYVADSGNLVVVPGNGSGLVSFVGGYSHFTGLSDVFGDAQGTLWAVDRGAAQVVRITDGGTTFSLLPAPGAGWVSPVAVTVSTWGVVYVSDFDNACIVAIDSWGYGATTVITDHLSQPTGLWLAGNGDLFAGEFNNMYILKYPNGSTTATIVANRQSGGRPFDVGGSPWMSLWDVEQYEQYISSGLIDLGPPSSGSVGSWVDAEGLWLDC